MTTSIAVILALIACSLLVAVSYLLGKVTLAKASGQFWQERYLEEQAKVSDLENRLAAKTYGEYAAFEPGNSLLVAEPPPAELFDETGLLSVLEQEYGDGT